MAHFMDCELIHLHLEILGSTMNGAASLDLLEYLQAGAAQMRNLWGIVLFVKCLALLQVHGQSPKYHRRLGLVCVRSGWTGLLSLLTVTGPYRLDGFRDSHMLVVQGQSSAAMLPHAHMALRCEFLPRFGVRLDMIMICEAAAMTIGAVSAFKMVLLLGRCRYFQSGESRDRIPATGEHTFLAGNLVFTRSHFLPYSVGILFDATCLSLYWGLQLTSPSHRA